MVREQGKRAASDFFTRPVDFSSEPKSWKDWEERGKNPQWRWFIVNVCVAYVGFDGAVDVTPHARHLHVGFVDEPAVADAYRYGLVPSIRIGVKRCTQRSKVT